MQHPSPWGVIKGFVPWVALIISGISLWQSQLAPFRPHIIFESVIWRLEVFEQPQANILTLINTIQVTNSGARTGCIQDVYLEVMTHRGTRWTFLPANYVDVHAFFRTTPSEKRSIMHFIESPFYSLLVPGKDQVTVGILFLPSDPGSIGKLTPGEYVIRLQARVCGEADYRPYGPATFALSAEDIGALESGLSFSGVSKEVQEARPK